MSEKKEVIMYKTWSSEDERQSDFSGNVGEEYGPMEKAQAYGQRQRTSYLDIEQNTSVRTGGTRGLASYNRPFEVINVYTGLMAFGTSTLSVENRAAEHAGVTLYNQPYQYRLDTPRNINLMESYYYTGARQVANYLNEAKYRDSLHLQGAKTLETSIELMTTNSKVSPVIDLERTNATITRNLIDDPQPLDNTFGPATATLTLNDTFTNVTKGQSLLFTDNEANRSVVVEDYNEVTKKIKVKGKFANKLNTLTQLGDVDLADIGLADVVVQDFAEEFIPETRSNGSIYSKWISRLFLFENFCDGVEIKLSCIFYANESIKVYFRPKTVGFDFEVSETPWIPFNETGLANGIESIKPRSADNVDPNVIKSGEWKTLTWSVQDLAKFDGLQLKIVMTSENPAQAPLIDDLQMVCTE